MMRLDAEGRAMKRRGRRGQARMEEVYISP